MGTTSRTIRFYFDYESPNAYLAWNQLPRLAEKYGREIDAVPVLYAALLDASGTLGPGETPAKGRWMLKNVLRKAARIGLSIQCPIYFPFNPLLALRISLLPLEAPSRHKLIDALFEAVWYRSLHVSEPAVVERVANELGLPGADLIAQASRPEIKSQLRRQTDDAIARGVFGVPTMEVGDELFWATTTFRFWNYILRAAIHDYKEALPGNSPDSHRDFLYDASSLANAGGGLLMFGVRERRDDAGRPTGEQEAAPGLAGFNQDAAIQRMESMLRDWIEPRLPGVRAHVVPGLGDGPRSTVQCNGTAWELH